MHFLLFTSCKVVEGYKQSLLYDLQHSRYLPLPTELAQLLKEANYTINLSLVDEGTLPYIKAFCENLVENDFGFFYENPEEFVSLPLDYDTPSIIKNAVIVFNHQRDYVPILEQLNELGCETITLVINSDFKTDALLGLLEKIETYDFIFAEIIYLLTADVSVLENIQTLVADFVILKRIVFYNHGPAPFSDVNFGNTHIYYKQINQSDKFNPVDEFAVNYPFFIEAQNHNVYYNQKVFIDENLHICNHITII